MTAIVPGRFTAQVDEPLVVFVIGMRINRLRAVRKWLPVLREMGPMLRTLYEHPEKGLLHAETCLMWRGVVMIQYWRSFEHLENFARNRSDPHAAAWQRFMKNVGGDGTVGIFHETYTVQPGTVESVYANMPRFGLAAATEHVPATGSRATARARLRTQSHHATGASAEAPAVDAASDPGPTGPPVVNTQAVNTLVVGPPVVNRQPAGTPVSTNTVLARPALPGMPPSP